ncbi:MAG TPA: alanine racemase [Dehalococcoidia bacterium]|nr:alanine racemase [Dehalococcoidia bacterium]
MLNSRLPTGQTLLLNTQTDNSARETALKEGLRVWAEIDLDQLSANVKALKEQAGEARLLVVVKANAYGHGAVQTAIAAVEAGAWGLGVASLEEGEELRRAGITAPILVLSSSAPAQAQRLVESDLRATIGTLELGRALSRAATSLGSHALVHVKVETGMNRYGVPPEEAEALALALRDLPGVTVEGVSSHLASSDEPDKTFTHQQYERFMECSHKLDWIPIHHISNTGALLDLPDLRLGLVRTGIGVYGYYPSATVRRDVSLQPILALRSRVARVATLEVGEGVGYGLEWHAERRSRVALILAGYGDGIRRTLSNRGQALVRGARVPYAGRVAMDMLMLDVTDVPGVALDDEVTLLGHQGSECIDADEMAALCNTISYEVLCGLMERVPRLYTRGGRIVARHDLAGLRETPAP